jgi:hypothetical protein
MLWVTARYCPRPNGVSSGGILYPANPEAWLMIPQAWHVIKMVCWARGVKLTGGLGGWDVGQREMQGKAHAKTVCMQCFDVVPGGNSYKTSRQLWRIYRRNSSGWCHSNQQILRAWLRGARRFLIQRGRASTRLECTGIKVRLTWNIVPFCKQRKALSQDRSAQLPSWV